jgi:hypothetical protein
MLLLRKFGNAVQNSEDENSSYLSDEKVHPRQDSFELLGVGTLGRCVFWNKKVEPIPYHYLS